MGIVRCMTELAQEFQEFRRILCICPCCGELVRVSDLHIRSKGKVQRTWLDKYEKKVQIIEEKICEFEEKEKEMREEAHQKGRLAAEERIYNTIHPCFRDITVNPNDIKPILHPIDFIIFQNMNKGPDINEIMFFSMHQPDKTLQKIRDDINDLITERSYEWIEVRIDDKGDMAFK